MNILELHTLHSLPLSAVNCNESGSPKQGLFGGVSRALISSQAWKHYQRIYCKNLNKYYGGIRTTVFAELLADALKGELELEKAIMYANAVSNYYLSKKEKAPKAPSKKPKKKEDEEEIEDEVSTDSESVKTPSARILFVSPMEINSVANKIISATKDGTIDKLFKIETKKDGTKCTCLKAFIENDENHEDMYDIFLFGRYPSDIEIGRDGAILFSTRFSTHPLEQEFDFFTSVSDNATEKGGASFLGDREVNSSCFYGYTGINLDKLWEYSQSHKDSEIIFKKVIETFIESTILSIPETKRTSMNYETRDPIALGVVRTGSTMNLANAFEEPIIARGKGYLKPSRIALEKYWKERKEFIGSRMEVATEMWVPDNTLDTFIEEMSSKCLLQVKKSV